VLSALLLATSVAVALVAVSRPAPPGASVLLAAHDLAPGVTLDGDDLREASRPSGTLPDGALTSTDQAVGRVLASGARGGEVLTDVRLVGPGLVDVLPPGEVAAPVRIADASAAALLVAGATVDVLVAVEGGMSAQTVVHDATVLTRPQPSASGGLLGPEDDAAGALVVLATTADEARSLAGAAARGPLSLALRGP
jgi:Flp pilus assembly protein CpaB